MSAPNMWDYALAILGTAGGAMISTAVNGTPWPVTFERIFFGLVTLGLFAFAYWLNHRGQS